MKKQNESNLYSDFVQKAKDGDAAAFLNLYHMTYSTQFSIAFKVLENYHYAEDAVQEAYLCAWKDLPDLQDDNRFIHWLNRITYHRALDILKTVKKHRTDTLDLLSEAALEQISVSALPPLEDLAIQNELSALLLEAVEQLPTRQQTALKGRYFAFMTNREIAQQMNCTENDVKYYVRSGKQKLEKLIKKLYGKNGNYKNWVFAPFLPGMLKTFSKQMSAGHAVHSQSFIAGNSVRPIVAVISALCVVTGVGAGASLFYHDSDWPAYGTCSPEGESSDSQIPVDEYADPHIDRSPPAITQYRCIGSTLDLYVEDLQSGVDYSSIYALFPDGTKISPQTDASSLPLITFTDIQFPVTFYIQDQQGNEKSYYCEDPETLSY